jgi:nonspecific dipeptidase
MSISEAFQSIFFNYVDRNTDLYIKRLREAVAIQSVSSNLEAHLSDINCMMEWTAAHIHRLGGDATLMPNPKSSQEKELPPILLGDFVVDPSKKTVCVYGHLDVQPADKSDGWNTDPFVLTEIDGKLFGRGSTDDKGPALSWLWVIEAYKDLGEDLPVNIKLLYEGMEESGSEGMEEAVVELVKPGGFLNDVDFFCISDNYWTGKRKPCITYGLRGLAAFMVTVQCCEQDLHSGVIGGTIHEAMTDLVHILASLKEPTGKILIDGIMDDVLPVTPEEQALYRDIDFDVDSFKVKTSLFL